MIEIYNIGAQRSQLIWTNYIVRTKLIISQQIIQIK